MIGDFHNSDLLNTFNKLLAVISIDIFRAFDRMWSMKTP